MKKQKLFILCAILCVAILCGCTNSKFIIDNNADKYSNVKTYSEKDHFFFWGMGKKHDHDFSKICPNGKIVKMTTNNNWIDELLVSCTMGIYYTRTFTAYCATEPTAESEIQK